MPGSHIGCTLPLLTRILLTGTALLLQGPAYLLAQQSYVVRDTAIPCLNIRSEPDPEAAEIDCLSPGTQVIIITSIPYWRQVRLADGQLGWGAKKFLEFIGTVAPVTPGCCSFLNGDVTGVEIFDGSIGVVRWRGESGKRDDIGLPWRLADLFAPTQ